MKKLILLLALAFVMCGCYRQNADGSYTTGNALNEFRVITIDSCEYIVDGYWMAHKGNCKFCAERKRKEQEELICRLKED
jgi:hypothetical protein